MNDNDPDNLANDPALDELIAAARWPEPSPESERRLREAWLAMSGERRRTAQRRWWGACAAGAAAAAIIIVAVMQWPRRNQPQPDIAQRPVTLPVPEPSRPPRTVALWRPAKPWEVALVQLRPRAPVAATTRPHATSRPNSLIARVDDAVQSVASGAGDAAAVAAELRADFPADRLEQRLTPIAIRAAAPRRLAAVGLLAQVATPRSAPLLASLAGDPAVRADAVAGLLRVGDVPTLAALAGSAVDDSERRRLLAALLERDPGRAVPVYLAFLSDESTAAAALAALDDVPSPPVDALFARLNDARRANRLAAARALGRIDGPFVTARLAAMVRQNVNRHEALAALASSDGAEAKAFFQWALASKELGAAARTARQGLNQL